jgi:hypothetical protein
VSAAISISELERAGRPGAPQNGRNPGRPGGALPESSAGLRRGTAETVLRRGRLERIALHGGHGLARHVPRRKRSFEPNFGVDDGWATPVAGRGAPFSSREQTAGPPVARRKPASRFCRVAGIPHLPVASVERPGAVGRSGRAGRDSRRFGRRPATDCRGRSIDVRPR